MITTTRLTLRPWKDSDRDAFADLNADPRVMEHFSAPLSRAESDALATRIATHIDEHGWGLWAAEVAGEFAGFIGLSTVTFDTGFPAAPEIGWRLAHQFWGSGIATEGAAAVLEDAFGRLKFARVVSFTSPFNVRSRRVMEKIGMHQIGTFDHPRIAEGHPLRPHVLYEVSR